MRSRSPKVHVLDIGREDVGPDGWLQYMGSGCGTWAYGWQMVRESTFRNLPKRAQCGRCDNRWHVHSCATAEQMTAVECFLIGTSRVFAAWPDDDARNSGTDEERRQRDADEAWMEEERMFQAVLP